MSTSISISSERNMQINNDTIVLYPSPGIGHLVSMVELAKLILIHHPDSFSRIIILITTAPNFNTGSTGPYISRVSATTPSITFHHLPEPATSPPPNPGASVEAISYEFLTLNNPNVHQALQSISSTKSSKIKAFIIDFFCTPAFEVSSSLNIPTFYFFTSGASALSFLLYLPIIHETTTTSLKDLNAFLDIPGSPPIFSSEAAKPVQDRSKVEHKYFVRTALQMAISFGIIVNTFQSLEPRAITAISDGLCIPNAPTTGGTRGARGAPAPVPQEPDLNALLPQGFLDRTKGRGLVVKSWAPQIAVLNHESVGGFVTHCGWNSILEGVCAGVPMIGWPLYAEQGMNKVVLVEELKLGLGLGESGEGRFVSGAELEKQVRELMESKSGEMVRRRVMEMSHAAKTALGKDDGSSRIALANLIAKWK